MAQPKKVVNISKIPNFLNISESSKYSEKYPIRFPKFARSMFFTIEFV